MLTSLEDLRRFATLRAHVVRVSWLGNSSEFYALEMSGVERDKYDTHRFGKLRQAPGVQQIKLSDTDKVNALLFCLCFAREDPDGVEYVVRDGDESRKVKLSRVYPTEEPAAQFMLKVAEAQRSLPGTFLAVASNKLLAMNGLGVDFEKAAEKNSRTPLSGSGSSSVGSGASPDANSSGGSAAPSSPNS